MGIKSRVAGVAAIMMLTVLGFQNCSGDNFSAAPSNSTAASLSLPSPTPTPVPCDNPTPHVLDGPQAQQVFTVPTGVTYIKIEAWGGGGGGLGGAGGSGGGGSYCSTAINNIPSGQTYNIVVGGGGVGQLTYAQGGTMGSNGGDTSFGDTLCVAGGGVGGNGAGGLGGTATSSLAPGEAILTNGQSGLDMGGENFTAPGGNSPLGGDGGTYAAQGVPHVPENTNCLVGNTELCGMGISPGGGGGAKTTRWATFPPAAVTSSCDNTADFTCENAGGNGGNGRIILWYCE